MNISVHYTTLVVNDLAESVAFYRDVLGFREGYHVDLPVGAITIMESPGGACVELIMCKLYETGFYSVGADVEDLDETIARLKRQGHEILGGIIQTTVGRHVFVQDPNGVRICLIEHSAAYRAEHMQKKDC